MNITHRERQVLIVALDSLILRITQEAAAALEAGRIDIVRIANDEAPKLLSLRRRLEVEQPIEREATDGPASAEVYRATLSSIARAQAAARESSARSEVPAWLRKRDEGDEA